ncbi:uncharacterized protein RSE6_04479 [Rhynchosporium secalis]|uniref:Uncharacterized protein n=1 Tax=Rhynchosporium secalis TaxID=38038 RepID=A0A1E1M5F2_RHYSE|nr:uncharacterized protein RSE6_04479 [Rhynchosporium secalis]
MNSMCRLDTYKQQSHVTSLLLPRARDETLALMPTGTGLEPTNGQRIIQKVTHPRHYKTKTKSPKWLQTSTAKYPMWPGTSVS